MADPMYPAKAGSPTAFLTGAISDVDVVIAFDADVLPDAPNLATLGTGAGAEVVLYATKVGTTISNVTRGYSGTVAQAWVAGTAISRRFTSYDHDTFIDNINTGAFDGGEV